MKLKNFLKSLLLLALFTALVNTSAFATTWYVSNTNGNDVAFPGTQAQPFKTITKALSVVVDGDVISIQADTYNETGAALIISNSITFVSTAFNGLNVATITNGITINGSGKTVNMGRTSDGSVMFNLGATAGALTLTAGTLNIDGANVVIGSGATITRSGGTINATPTTTNVNVTYIGNSSIAAGPELPASLGTGTLIVNLGAAAATLSVGSNLNLSTGKIINSNVGSVSFTGNVAFVTTTIAANAIDNQNTGSVTFGNAVTFTKGTAGTISTVLNNGSTGTLSLNSGISATLINVGLNNTAAGVINLGGGNYANTVINDAGGTININGATTFSTTTVSNNNAASRIKLGSNQLTLSGAGATLTNLGKITSGTDGQVGTGLLAITGTVTANSGGDLTGVAITGGGLTLGANTTVYGGFTMNTGATVNDAGFTLSVKGDFVRNDNTPGNWTTVGTTGTLDFSGAVAQNFNPGASLTLSNVTVNESAGVTVTMLASVNVNGNVTINTGSLNLGPYNINLLGNPSIFTNSGNFYSSTGNGYLVFQGVTGTLTGTGTFGNLLINTSAGGAVTATTNIKFSGILNLYNGNLAMGANNLTLTSDNVAHPSVIRNLNPANAGTGQVTGAGTFGVSAGVTYNLTYIGVPGAGTYPATSEWTAGLAPNLNNLSISTGSSGVAIVVQGPATASTIAGNLTVNSNQALDLNARIATLSGANAVHAINGTVQNGTLNVTGAGETINGSTAAADAAQINLLTVAPGVGNAFTSNNLKVINGNVVVTNGNAAINMNATSASVTGNVTLTTGSLNLNMASTTSTHTGNIIVTAGTLTYTRGSAAAQEVLTGTVTLNGGTFALGSNLSVTGQTTVAAGSLSLGAFNYTQLGSVATPDFNRTGAGLVTGTGALVLDATLAAIDVTPGASFTVPNITFVDGGANGITLNAPFTVANSIIHTSGAVTLNTLTLSGNTYSYAAGTYPSGTLVFTGSAPVATFAGNVTIPNITVNSTGSLTIQSDKESTPTPRTVTVSGALTQTAGDINLGINTLRLTGAAGAFVRTAGNWNMGTGLLQLNGGGLTFNPGTGFAVDNLTVSTAAANSTQNVFTVNKNLILAAALQTASAAKDNILQVGDGATIERQAAAATIDKKVTFLGKVNLLYSTAGPITLGNEVPSVNVINNFTIAAPSGAVLNNSQAITINGTLSLAGLLNATTASPKGQVTMANGSTLELKANNVLDQALTVPGTINLVYNGATLTSPMELGAITSNMHTTPLGNVAVKSAITLDAGITVNGTLTLGANIDQTAANYTVNVNGGLVQTAANAFFVNRAAAVNFGGTKTALTLAANQAVPGSLMFTVNKTNTSDSLVLSGGNLDFAANSATLYLAKGVLVTGSNVVILKQNAASGQPTQGFSKTGVSYVIGNVQKFIDQAASIAISYVQFPVGTPDGNYRQLDYYFKNTPQSSINLTVSASNVSAGGSNGFPITAGNLTLTNYTPFFWYVKSDVPLAPSYKYDMDAQAQGYTDYITDQIQNVRFVRRDSGNINNQWILQGGSVYDNSTIAANWPVVKVIDAQGGFSTQGSIFAYSQLNKPPKFTAASGNLAKNGLDTVSVTFTAVDPDLNQTATLSATVLPSWLTFTPATGKLYGIAPNVATTYNVTVRATDNLGAYTDTSFTITVTFVNHKPTFTAQLADTTIKNGVALTFKYAASDVDAGQTLKYMLVPINGLAGTSSIGVTTGTLTITPAFADAGKSFSVTVKVTDGIDTVTSNTATVTVIHATKRGDVNGDGKIDGADAVQLLNWVVGITPPAIPTPGTPLFYAADVDGNGTITVNDAYFALFAATHDTLPNGQMPKMSPPSGDLSFNGMTSGEGGVVNVPLRLANTNNVLSAYIELNIDNKLANIQTIASNLPQGWMMAHNYVNGKLIIAMTGTKPLNDGNFATISLKLNSSETKLDISGSVKFNDVLSASLSNLTVKEIPSQFGLSQNYPNPFNPTTTIKYQIAQDTKVVLDIYDMLGQRVRSLVNDVQSAGYYNVTWDGQNSFGQQVASGVYIYRLQAGNFVQTMKMNLLK
ncbi:MAG: FlgD immunoglobulin-like domain containing protein [Ignavibacteriaceae bacterium]